MSNTTVPSRANGQTIDQTWFNVIQGAISGNIVPRNPSGVATDLAGSIGESNFRMLKAFIASGHLDCGDIKLHHSFNGAAPVGEGWMKCDGRVVNQSTYDTEHGTGHWVTYVGSSPIDGKHLPDFTNRVPVGVSATTQDGTGAITPVGNASHQINLSHSHVVDSHAHTINSPNVGNTPGVLTGSATNWGAAAAYSTGAASPGTDSRLSSAQSVQPDSIETLVYMRII